MLKRIAALIAVVLFLVPLLGSAELQREIVEYEISYILKLGGIKVGSTYGKLTRIDTDRYESLQKLNPGLMLKVIGERKSTQTSIVNLDASGTPLAENYVVEFKRKKPEHAEFDWVDRTITLSDGEAVPMPEHQVFEWASWYMNLMLTDPSELPGTRITVVAEEQILEYEYVEPEEVTIEVDSKSLTVNKIRMQQVKDNKEAFTMWLSPDYYYLPVKMQRHKKGVTVDIIMDSVEFNN